MTAAELVAQIFQEAGAGGVVFEDPDLLNQVTLQADEYFSQEVLAGIPQHYGIKAYFPVDDRLGERLESLKVRLSTILPEPVTITLNQVKEEDWAEAWKTYFKPELIGRVVIKPSWESYQPEANEIVVELDPGMAFGTGAHPSTRMCVALLQELIGAKPISMLDLGTGSGILSAVAAKLGVAPIVASDIDPLAVRTAKENIAANQVTDQVRLMEGDLLNLGLTEQFDLVVANIIAKVIMDLIPNLATVLKPGGLFLTSGIIDERGSEVEAALVANGFTIQKTLNEDGWVAIVAMKS